MSVEVPDLVCDDGRPHEWTEVAFFMGLPDQMDMKCQLCGRNRRVDLRPTKRHVWSVEDIEAAREHGRYPPPKVPVVAPVAPPRITPPPRASAAPVVPVQLEPEETPALVVLSRVGVVLIAVASLAYIVLRCCGVLL